MVKTSPRPPPNGTSREYSVSIVCRDEVSAFKPYLWHQSTFENVSSLSNLMMQSTNRLKFSIQTPRFREWLLTKIINGERASYSAPKFARMQVNIDSIVGVTKYKLLLHVTVNKVSLINVFVCLECLECESIHQFGYHLSQLFVLHSFDQLRFDSNQFCIDKTH